MDPQLLIVLGFVLLAAGSLVLLSFGPRFRVGRLLAATPEVPIGAALEAAGDGRAGYVAVAGRIDSDTDFEDAAHRPLVLRRTRIQVRRPWGWATVEDGTEAVPFRLNEGLASIAVDGPALGPGLVVVPRESVGTAVDLADRVPARTAAATVVRAVVEQVSAVDHAIVLGVPVRAGDAVTMTAGAGRPLVLTTLERDEAMRVLTGGDRGRTTVAAVLLGAGLVVLAAGFAAAAVGALR